MLEQRRLDILQAVNRAWSQAQTEDLIEAISTLQHAGVWADEAPDVSHFQASIAMAMERWPEVLSRLRDVTRVVSDDAGIDSLLLATGAIDLSPFWHFSGAFHPVTVHFPIALLLVAALLEGIALLRRRRRPRPAAVTCLWLGAVGALVAATLGWANADAAGELTGELAPIVSAHRWLGVALVALALATATVATLARRRPLPALLHAYRGGVFAAAAMVGLVGSYGGKITYGPGHYDDAFKRLMVALQPPARQAFTDVAGVDAAPADLASASLAAASTSPPSPDVPDEAGDSSPAVLAASPAAVRATSAPSGTFATAQAMTRVDFARDVQPILLTTCVKCHTRRKRMGRYRLDDRQHMFLPGKSGTPPIVPGRSADSLLVKLIDKGEHEDNRMPPKGPPLTGDQIALIRRWMDEGAE